MQWSDGSPWDYQHSTFSLNDHHPNFVHYYRSKSWGTHTATAKAQGICQIPGWTPRMADGLTTSLARLAAAWAVHTTSCPMYTPFAHPLVRSIVSRPWRILWTLQGVNSGDSAVRGAARG